MFGVLGKILIWHFFVVAKSVCAFYACPPLIAQKLKYLPLTINENECVLFCIPFIKFKYCCCCTLPAIVFSLVLFAIWCRKTILKAEILSFSFRIVKKKYTFQIQLRKFTFWLNFLYGFSFISLLCLHNTTEFIYTLSICHPQCCLEWSKI